MELGGELQRGADEWLMTLEKECRRLQVIVGELSLQSHEEPEVEGGAISVADWLKDMTDDMLDIIWELEEGPDPQLEACIDWRRVDGMMSTCYALFTESQNPRYMLEERLEGDNDMEDEDWQENGAKEDEDNSGVNNNNNNNDNNNDNNNNNNNNNNNDNNNDKNDNNNGDSINNNGDSINNDNYNDNNNNYVDNNSFNNDSAVGDDGKSNNKDNNNSNNNNNENNNDDHGNSGTGSSDRATNFIIRMVSEMSGSDVDSGKGIGAETKWCFILPPSNLHRELLLAVWLRAGVG
ncbi:hypothetical protein CBR_g434 [Chara braunii]|uniref:Uncharacterized protein n=1 Tax=Chara braunii TaxID=69332 RepID=A0A388KB56_CHABU|nr:hypothetical protein CBR_g434 [Chara braunii]|eukprot:GBG67295.1 hypothetical protein CBR_g434 [Chara braunii]